MAGAAVSAGSERHRCFRNKLKIGLKEALAKNGRCPFFGDNQEIFDDNPGVKNP